MELVLVNLNEPLERIALFLSRAPGAIVYTGGKVPLARSAVPPPIPRSVKCGWEIDVVSDVPVPAPIGVVANGDGIVSG